MSETITTSHVYTFLEQEYLKAKSKVLFALEGSSGAAKTWGAIDFILQYCRINAGQNKRITIGRETYRDCMETIAYDFIKRLKMIEWYDKNCHTLSHPQKYELLGNSIEFTGWSSNGQPSKRQDVLWFNEILESKEEDFKQYNQRTNEVVIFDWNPKTSEHWVYNKLLDRPDCKYKHCLMLDNPFLPEGQRNEILAYEPTPENVKNGTADDYMWKVYGLGIRTNPQGLIFKHVNWLDEFPKDMDYSYGMDFGFVNDPTVIVKYAETPSDIFIEYLCYEPIDNPYAIDEFATKAGINKYLPVTADSADKYTAENKGTVQMVRDLKNLGWNIRKVNKNKSIIYWLGSMNRKRINVVRSVFAQREFSNYKYREINGLVVNEPIDKFNHGIDAARYRHMELNSGSGLQLM
jgi:PBSX family phage terminase large subunit